MSRIKKCRNPECRKEIIGVRKDCNDKHKQRYHYLRRHDVFSEDYYWNKQYNKIVKEITRLYKLDKTKIPLSFLEFMEIDLTYLKQKFKNEDGKDCYIINDLMLTTDEDKNLLITKNDKLWGSLE